LIIFIELYILGGDGNFGKGNVETTQVTIPNDVRFNVIILFFVYVCWTLVNITVIPLCLICQYSVLELISNSSL